MMMFFQWQTLCTYKPLMVTLSILIFFRFILEFNVGIVLLVVDNILVDNDVPMVTFSISRFVVLTGVVAFVHLHI